MRKISVQGRCRWFQYVARPFLCGVTKPSTGLLSDVKFVLQILSIESRLLFLRIRVYGNGEIRSHRTYITGIRVSRSLITMQQRLVRHSFRVSGAHSDNFTARFKALEQSYSHWLQFETRQCRKLCGFGLAALSRALAKEKTSTYLHSKPALEGKMRRRRRRSKAWQGTKTYKAGRN